MMSKLAREQGSVHGGGAQYVGHAKPTQLLRTLALLLCMVVLGYAMYAFSFDPSAQARFSSSASTQNSRLGQETLDEKAVLAEGDDVEIELPCMKGKPFVMRGHNLGVANIRVEFAEDEYGVCNATASGLDGKDGGLVVVRLVSFSSRSECARAHTLQSCFSCWCALLLLTMSS